LAEYLKEVNKIELTLSIEWTKQILEGLVVMHEKKIMHRDIDPTYLISITKLKNF